MAQTMNSYSASHLGSEFNLFLFAVIGEDGNEMPLSVISALARLGVDPWTEASELAREPAETATRRLAALLGRLPDRPSQNEDGDAIIGSLIALLPGRVNPPAARGGPSRGAFAAVGSGAAVLIYVFAMAAAMGVFGVNNSHHRPLTQTRAEPPGAGAISLRAPISIPSQKRTFPTLP